MKAVLSIFSPISIRILGAAGNFFLLVVINTLYGPAMAGFLFVVSSTGYMIAQVSNIGLHRYIPFKIQVRRDEVEFEGIKMIGFITSSIPLATALLMYASRNGELEQNPESMYFFAILFGASASFNLICADLLKARGRASLALAIEATLLPAITALGVLTLNAIFKYSIDPIIFFISTSFLLMLLNACLPLGGNLFISLILLKKTAASLISERRKLLTFWLSGIAIIFTSRITGILAPLTMSAHDTGLFATAIGFVSLGGTFVYASQAKLAPEFRRAFLSRSKILLVKYWIISCALSVTLFSPILYLCVHHAIWIARVFGVEYTERYGAMIIILSAGQAIRMLAGNSEILLSMVEREGAEFCVIIASIIIFFCVLLLIPFDGPMAIAYCFAFMQASRGVLSILVCLHVIRSIKWVPKDLVKID